jgi:nucleoid-associated protein YgaU
LDLKQGWKQVMTRETKIGLLLGMCVILLIGIIISDQLSQPQQDPADFTDFAREAQRSIDASDAMPGYRGAPASSAPGIANPDTPVGGSSPVIEPPSDFFIPSDRIPSPGPQRQADSTAPGSQAGPASNGRPLTLNNVDDVPTVRIGQPQIELPHRSAANQAQPLETTTRPAPPPRGSGSAIRHTVLKGETLTRIAQRYYGNGDSWRTIARANPGKVTLDGQVQLGAVLKIPKRDDALRGSAFVDAGSERVIPVGVINSGSPGRTIEVKAGDTLSELAARHLGSASKWEDLLEANSQKLSDPESLRVGMKLRLPGKTTGGQAATATPSRPSTPTRSGKTYTVRPGDNLTEIAEKTLGDGSRWRDVFQANRDKLKSADRLIVGQELRIPS